MVAVKSLRGAFLGLAVGEGRNCVAVRVVPSMVFQLGAEGRSAAHPQPWSCRVSVVIAAARQSLICTIGAVAAFLGVEMQAVDGKVAIAAGDIGAGEARKRAAVAPVDRPREVAGRRTGIGVGEGRAQRSRGRLLDGTCDGDSPRRQRRIRNPWPCRCRVVVLPPTSLIATLTLCRCHLPHKDAGSATHRRRLPLPKAAALLLVKFEVVPSAPG